MIGVEATDDAADELAEEKGDEPLRPGTATISSGRLECMAPIVLLFAVESVDADSFCT